MSVSFGVAQVLEDGPTAQRRLGEAVVLPGKFNEYVLAVQEMLPAEFFSWCRTVVLARRAGSYEFVDTVLFLLAFFSASEPGTSLAGFADDSARYGPELAGVGERVKWMSQASLSRALSSVDPTCAKVASAKLLELTSAFSPDAPLATTAGYRDGQGEPWSVLHWDTTVKALRQRALPADEGLPEPIRLAADFAEPGYPGRKRGEVQVSRSVLQDATSAVWLHVDLQPGNGRLAEQLGATADAAALYLRRDAMRSARAVVIADGVGGGVVQAVQLHARGLLFLTRWSQYEVLDECSEVIHDGPWHPVTDSKSGPRREAIELGTTTLQGAITCRVIATRFRAKPGRQRGVGRSIAGWRYELFITTLPLERWAAEDVVTLYYGRNAIENRFAAERREFGLERVFSYTLPGQLLSSAVAMALWNLRTAGGFVAVPQEGPSRPLRERSGYEATKPEPLDDDQQAPEPGEAAPEAAHDVAKIHSSDPRQDWCTVHPEWTVDPHSEGLRCPAGQVLPLSAIRPPHAHSKSWTARYRANPRTCTTCELRQRCSPTAEDPKYRREINIRLEAPVPLPERQDLSSGNQPELRPRRRVVPLPIPLQPPPFLPEATVLLPAPLRRKACGFNALPKISVRAPEVEPRRLCREELAEDDADRQRRRLTIEERVALNQREHPSEVTIDVLAPREAIAWIAALKALLNPPSRSA